nr:site-2 protease family protein [Thermus albus]
MVYLSIALHEWGHFVALRRFEVPVSLWAVGGPPWLWRWRRGGTEYRIGLLPLLGFVNPGERDFAGLRPWQKVLVYLAGPGVNFLAALVGLVALGFLGDWGIFWRGLALFFTLPPLLVSGLVGFFLGLIPAGEAGFLAFFRQGATLLEGGVVKGLALWVSLQLALAWFNLLPLPPLDGGQALLALGERWSLVMKVGRAVTVAGVVFLFLSLLWGLGYDLGLLGR